MAEKIWISGTFTGVYDSTYGAFMLTLSGEYIWTTQETYNAWQANTDSVTVIYDGEEFICEVQEISGLGKAIGNLSSFGGVGNNEPFALGVVADQGLYAWVILSTVDTTSTEHTVEVYQVEASTTFALVLKDRSGADVTYEVPSEQIKLNTPNGTQIFTAGQAVDNVSITLDLADGDQTVTAGDGQLIKSAIIQKPATLVPANIVKDVDIAGVVGAFEGGGGSELASALITREFTEVSIPAGVTQIGAGAFAYCSTLTSITATDNITYIGNSAFVSCSSLASAYFPACESIGAYAFSRCLSLSNVNFPVCNSIGVNAFIACSNLTTADFPACMYVDLNAFALCSGLSSVNMPTVYTIGSGAFSGCSNLTIASFPRATTLSSSAFKDCSNLTTADFPSCGKIGANAFYGCYKLTSIDFPKCREIGSSAFYNCYNLLSVNFPYSSITYPVISIYSSAFYNCNKLSTAIFVNYASIGVNAFRYCSQLTSLYLLGSKMASMSSSTTFYNTPMSSSGYTGAFGSIFVRASLLATYKANTYWKYYSSRFVGLTDEEIAALGVTV